MMKRHSFISLFLNEKKLVLYASLLMILQSIFAIANPLIMKYSIDILIPANDLFLLKKFSLLIIAIILLEAIINFLNKILIPFISNKIQKKLKYDLLSHIISLDLDFYTQNNLGKLNNVMERDTYIVKVFIEKNFFPLFAQSFNFILMTIILFLINWKISLVIMILLPVFFIFYTSTGKRIEKEIPEYYETHDNVSQVTLQCLSGIETIKAFNKEDDESNSFGQVSNKLIKIEKKINIIDSFGEVFSNFFGNFTSMVFLIFSITLIYKGTMTLGSSLAYYAYLTRLFIPAQQLSSLISQSKRSLESFNRIRYYLNLKPKIIDSPNPIDKNNLEKSIKFHNVGFTYDTNKLGNMILNNIDIILKKNSSIALVGKSGSGKSTLAKLLMRFYDTIEGNIFIDDVDIKDIAISNLRKLIAYIGQDSFLFNKTIRENIMYSNVNADEESLIEVCKKANIYDFIINLKDGFDTVVGERGIKLSGGERQRVAIARALLKSPQIIIFDEATSNLDTKNEKIIQESIKLLSQECTLLIITHRLAITENVDCIYVLKEGEICESGTFDELIALEKEYYSLWTKETKQ